MSVQTFNVQATAPSWKYLWRGEAILNILGGDVLIFATSWVIDLLGMESSATTPLRLIGVVFSLYGLWQLWMARSGSISQRTFSIAAVLMLLTGLDFVAAPVVGIEFSSFGSSFMVAMGLLCWVVAGAWYLASRQSV